MKYGIEIGEFGQELLEAEQVRILRPLLQPLHRHQQQ